jgi:hypothetical protein
LHVTRRSIIATRCKQPRSCQSGLLRLAHPDRPEEGETSRLSSHAETTAARPPRPSGLDASGGPRLRSVHRVGDHGGGGQGVGSLLRWGRAGGGVRGVGRPPAKGGPAGRFASRDPRLVVLLEANEGSLAHLLCKPLWVVARPTPRVFAQQNSLAYPHPYLLYLLTINLYRGSPLRRIAGD